MNKATATELLKKRLIPEWNQNFNEIDELDQWYRGKNPRPTLPQHVGHEVKKLQEYASTPFARLAVQAIAQNLSVEGYRRKNDSENAASWRIWQHNQMDARQSALYTGVLAHGSAYVIVLPGETPSGETMPTIRGVSARRMVAWYADPVGDEFPLYALRGEVIAGGKGLGPKMRWTFIDHEAVWTFEGDKSGATLTYITQEFHGAAVCPVVRYAADIDLDGRTVGEIEPLIPVLQRIDQTAFDRLAIQRSGAFSVRWATGIEFPENSTKEDRQAIKLKLGLDDILVAEGADSRFGSLAATDLGPFIESRQADERDFAAISQIPSHAVLGLEANLAAESLAAAEAGLFRKIGNYRHNLGESHEQVFRLASLLSGDTDGATDYEAEVVWADRAARSISQAADALGKMAQSLAIPPRALWDRIPGVTQIEVERWTKMAEEDDALGRLFHGLADNANPDNFEI